MRRRWRRNHLSQAPEINITAFMNLMVILVPFLLITAVFSRITILELDLPKASSAQPKQDDQPLVLEVTVREQSIELGDKQRGLLKMFTVTDDGRELKQLSDWLQQIKARHPDKTDITMLLEKDIPYERLVQMMDTLRTVQVKHNGETVNAELFPAISIGDAPPSNLRAAYRSQK